MDNRFARTQALIGAENMDKLESARIIIFGVGGVGGYVVEALARCGVGNITIVDNDTVDITNINRQIIATDLTIGKDKIDAVKDRVFTINPEAKVTGYKLFYNEETAPSFDFTQYDYIVDAIDTVGSKLLLIENAVKNNCPIISSMGTGNKLDPTKLCVTDLSKTSGCPLARAVRSGLRKRGIEHLKVVYSTEKACKPDYSNFIQNSEDIDANNIAKRNPPASISFVPSCAGLIIASLVVSDIISTTKK